MSALKGFYLNRHRDQFDGSPKEKANCTPTSGGNGADATTGGRVSKTGGQVRALVRPQDEVDPKNPGWHLADLARAMLKLAVGFTVRTGAGWSQVRAARAAKKYVVLQGDSDQFSNATCSGAFNGDHCIGIHPATVIHNGVEWWWIDDPICKTGRWESEAVLRRYATKLLAGIHFGVFDDQVPQVAPDTGPSLWGTDIPADIRALDPPGGSAQEWIRRTGVGSEHWKPPLNIGDLAAALDRAGIAWGGTVNVGDVLNLSKWRAP